MPKSMPKQKTSKPKVPAAHASEPTRSRLHRLSVPRSKLVRCLLNGGGKGGARCLLGNVLVAAGANPPEYEYLRGKRPPAAAAPFYTKRGALRAHVWDRIIGAFDEGDEALALITLRDYGWNVTILEDR